MLENDISEVVKLQELNDWATNEIPTIDHDSMYFKTSLKMATEWSKRTQLVIPDKFVNMDDRTKYILSKWIEDAGIAMVHYYTGQFWKSPDWRKLCGKIREENDHQCKKCGASGRDLSPQHIKPLNQYPDLAYVYSNVKLVCMRCINPNKRREIHTELTSLQNVLTKYNKGF